MDSDFFFVVFYHASELGAVMLCGLGLALARYRKDYPAWRRLTLVIASFMVFIPIFFPGPTVHSTPGLALFIAVITAYLLILGHIIQLILDS